MKSSYILAAATLSLLVAAGAQAETYQGVQSVASSRSRADVNEEAMRTASAPNQNVVRGSRGAEPFKSMADPAAVRAQAIATANAPDQNVSGGSRVNSRVISTMGPRADASVQAQQGTPASAK